MLRTHVHDDLDGSTPSVCASPRGHAESRDPPRQNINVGATMMKTSPIIAARQIAARHGATVEAGSLSPCPSRYFMRRASLCLRAQIAFQSRGEKRHPLPPPRGVTYRFEGVESRGVARKHVLVGANGVSLTEYAYGGRLVFSISVHADTPRHRRARGKATQKWRAPR